MYIFSRLVHHFRSLTITLRTSHLIFRNRNLVIRDSPLRVEIVNSSSRPDGSPQAKEQSVIRVFEPRESHSNEEGSQLTVHRRWSSDSHIPAEHQPRTKPKTQKVTKIYSSGLKRIVEQSLVSRKIIHLKTDTYHFFGIPRFLKKPNSKTISTATMSSETSAKETNATETSTTEATPTGDAKTQPVVVRVKSDHAGKPRSKPQNGETKPQEGGLKVPDSSEKKRRSMETLTAKMDFEDED